MAPQNSSSDSMQVAEVSVVPARKAAGAREQENQDESASESSIDRIPLRRWVMHGAIMFGREFCYAMETALVTPVLLQIGLPEQYYSLTWFLSPILGLIFTPLIGSASDRCTLRWGRRRPFILALCVGVLLGVALFLNGSIIGLAIGDEPNRQQIGIVLTVLGVVVLDFCADASEGPIRAYLLDVADTEEQDMALNIHAFSAGLGGAVGYMLGGLDWTHTFLGLTFKSQEQILFVFAAVLFVVSVALHLVSIEEEQYSPQQDRLDEEAEPEGAGPGGRCEQPRLELIREDEAYEDARSERELDAGFLEAHLTRSKSDSALAMADSELELDLERDPLFLRRGTQQQRGQPRRAGGRRPIRRSPDGLPARGGARRGGGAPGQPPEPGKGAQRQAGRRPPLLHHRHRGRGRGRSQRPRPRRDEAVEHQRVHAPPPPPHLLPAAFQHLLLLRARGLAPLPLPPRQRRGAHQVVAQHERPLRHAGAPAQAAAAAEEAPAPEREHHLQRGHGERGRRDGDHRAPPLALHAEDAPRAAASLRLSPAHLAGHHHPGHLLHRLHGPGRLQRRPQGRGEHHGAAQLPHGRADGLLGPGHLRRHRRHLLSFTPEVPGQLRPQHQDHLHPGHAGLRHRHGGHGRLPQRLRLHGDDKQHGHHLHEHLLLPLRPAGPVPRNQGVHPPQPGELPSRVRHRLRHPVVPGVHLPDPGGVGAGLGGGPRGQREGGARGGFGQLLPQLPDRHLPGDLPQPPRRRGDRRRQVPGTGRREAQRAEADPQGRGRRRPRSRPRVRAVTPPLLPPPPPPPPPSPPRTSSDGTMKERLWANPRPRPFSGGGRGRYLSDHLRTPRKKTPSGNTAGAAASTFPEEKKNDRSFSVTTNPHWP